MPSEALQATVSHVTSQKAQDTIPDLIDAVAAEFDVSSTTLYNLAWSESRLDPATTSPDGHDRGLYQINDKYHSEVSDKCAYDAKCATEWAAQRIKDGYLSEWVVANCYLFVKTKIPGLPPQREILNNSKLRVGAVAMFYYGNLEHFASSTTGQ